MSLVLSSLSGGNTVPTNGTSATVGGTTTAVGTAAAAGGGPTALPFAQTLVQTMGGSIPKGAETPLLGNLASLLQGLMNAVQTTGGETGDAANVQSADLLKGLTEDVEKLDENISADPALLAALQGWLLQVSALLTGSNAAGESSGSEGNTDAAAVLSPLAQNPETIRFAVQDELNSLVGLIKDAAAKGKEASAVKGAELLNQFSAIMAEVVNPENNKVKARGTNITDTAAASAKQPAGTEGSIKSNATDATVPVLVKPSTVTSTTQTAADASAATAVEEASADVIATQVTKPAASAEPLKSASTEEPLPEVKAAEGSHDIVTAGQLSIRDGIAAPLKAESAPVPVSQFAQQMDTFITGKLEIVKKGGVAEATITLFPENLGQVDVKITMQNGNLIAQFNTAHSGAKDMLEQQMSQLRAALQSQGIQVEKLEVTQNNTPLFSQFNGQQGRQPGSSGQQGGRSKERREEAGDAVLAAELNGEWKDWVAETKQSNPNQEGSFSAKA
ncbi:flagellar hook-length control protein FliK [Paenibacillus tianjinensis]|uniref:Flagellar hook-length control protein FliK n=1 Tax=Paenibacillus tianjinensis TaxID=2810347 RepID=A0ABX7L5M0_9BACL|nr:flagellar hook-length control protein FliK [Paenibacillus tianjinensis]QSF42936.1 flagellar hook-length control protein FliK [Paenibacillus tianjinensis]